MYKGTNKQTNKQTDTHPIALEEGLLGNSYWSLGINFLGRGPAASMNTVSLSPLSVKKFYLINWALKLSDFKIV